MRTLASGFLGQVDYGSALKLQERLVELRVNDRITDTILLLEHPHVFTLGRGARESDLLRVPQDVPVYRVFRGGQVTYHGPGQLVGYPIIKLEESQRDVHAYLRSLEEVIIQSLRTYGIEARRVAGFTGVWISNRKIASIGVGIRRWTTMHGFAINVHTDLRYFDAIVPCGIAGCIMTSMEREIPGCVVELEDFARTVTAEFMRIFNYTRQIPFNLGLLGALNNATLEMDEGRQA